MALGWEGQGLQDISIADGRVNLYFPLAIILQASPDSYPVVQPTLSGQVMFFIMAREAWLTMLSRVENTRNQTLRPLSTVALSQITTLEKFRNNMSFVDCRRRMVSRDEHLEIPFNALSR